MEIQLHGEYTEQDILHGLALIRGRAFLLSSIAVGIVLTLAFLPTAISMLSGKAESIDVLSAILPALLVLIIFAFTLWWVPRNQARKVREAPLFQGPLTGVATDEALALRSEQSEGRTKWTAFVRYKMSDQMVLLYQNQGAAMLLPRGFFANDDDWQQFRQHIRTTVPQKVNTSSRLLKWR